MRRTSAGSIFRPSFRSSHASESSIAGGAVISARLVRHAAHQPDARRNLAQQFDRASQPAHRVHRILRLFEAHARVRPQLDRRRRLADRRRLEIRALQHHTRSLLTDRAIPAADHPGQSDRARRIGDHQVRSIERVRFVIERTEPLRRPSPAARKSCPPAADPHRTRASAAPVPPSRNSSYRRCC